MLTKNDGGSNGSVAMDFPVNNELMMYIMSMLPKPMYSVYWFLFYSQIKYRSKIKEIKTYGVQHPVVIFVLLFVNFLHLLLLSKLYILLIHFSVHKTIFDLLYLPALVPCSLDQVLEILFTVNLFVVPGLYA